MIDGILKCIKFDEKYRRFPLHFQDYIKFDEKYRRLMVLSKAYYMIDGIIYSFRSIDSK